MNQETTEASSSDDSDIQNDYDFAQEFQKYADELTNFNYSTTKIDMFNIFNKMDEFALLAINNRLHDDVKEILSSLLNSIKKITDYDDSLLGVVTELKSITFTSVQMNGNPYTHRAMISKTCKMLNEAYQNLAKCFLKLECTVDIVKELKGILHDVISALERVDIRIESQKNSNNWETWKEFLINEHDSVVLYLLTHRYTGSNELVAELYLQTLREAANDSISMLQKLLDFLKIVVRSSNKDSQSILKKGIHHTDVALANYELELSKPNLDLIKLIQDSTKGIVVHVAKLIKYFLFENKATNEDEDANLKELAHYIGTAYIVSMRRYSKRIKI